MSTNPGAGGPEHPPTGSGPLGQQQPETKGVGAHESRHDRRSVVSREKEKYGGIKIGSAFFGWLTATGATVLLLALAAAITALIGTTTGGVDQAASEAGSNPLMTGIAGAVVLLLVWFLAYYCGGYVAGRMARFNGAKQGVAVWVWAVLISIILFVGGLMAGSSIPGLPASLPQMPELAVPANMVLLTRVVSLVAVAVVALIGAILGGLAGMRFHRRVDKEGLGE